jgi:hypothetical protein
LVDDDIIYVVIDGRWSMVVVRVGGWTEKGEHKRTKAKSPYRNEEISSFSQIQIGNCANSWMVVRNIIGYDRDTLMENSPAFFLK